MQDSCLEPGPPECDRGSVQQQEACNTHKVAGATFVRFAEILEVISMSRDDFTKEVLDALARRVNFRCSMPTCRTGTTGPRTEPNRSVNIGVAAHITAASPGGPRYDACLTSERRRSAENGIWLCQNHAKLVDNDAIRYPVGDLQDWKQSAEAAARADLEGARERDTASSAILDLSFKKVGHTPDLHPTRHDYVLTVTVQNCGRDRMSDYHVDLHVPAAVLELGRTEIKDKYVPDRSDWKTALLRSAGAELYPGDSSAVFGLPYFVDRQLYWNHSQVFQQIVRATMYRPGMPPLTTDKLFDELQNF